MMSPGVRKFALTTHLIASIGWIGAVVVYVALGIAAVTNSDTQAVRSAWTAMELTGWWVIVPLAVAALLTGLVMSLGTRWGLFRHYWTLISLMLTALCTVVLVQHMPSVSAMASVARRVEGDDLRALGGDLFHPSVGLLVLLVITVLNVYKPGGVTPYGWRKQREQRQAQRGGTAAVLRLPVGVGDKRVAVGFSAVARGAGSFILYFAEMWFVMMVGMMLSVPIRLVIAAQGNTALLDANTVGSQALMYGFMVAPMLAWMRIRGCSWRQGVEMGAGMLIPVAGVLVLSGRGGADALPWLSNSQHAAMLVGMLAVMLYRRDHYTRGYSLIGWQTASTRRWTGVRLAEAELPSTQVRTSDARADSR